jgi:hypothetical protein
MRFFVTRKNICHKKTIFTAANTLSEKDKLLILKKKVKFLKKENARLRREVRKLNLTSNSNLSISEEKNTYLFCDKCKTESAKEIDFFLRNGVKKLLICKNCNKTKIG